MLCMKLIIDENKTLNYRIDEYKLLLKDNINDLKNKLNNKSEINTHILYYFGPFSSGKTYFSKIIEREFNGVYFNFSLLSEYSDFYILSYLAYAVSCSGYDLPFTKYALTNYLSQFNELRGFKSSGKINFRNIRHSVPNLDDIPSQYRLTAEKLINNIYNYQKNLNEYLSLDLELYAVKHNEPIIIIIDDLFSAKGHSLDWLTDSEQGLLKTADKTLWVITGRNEIETTDIFSKLSNYTLKSLKMTYMSEDDVNNYFRKIKRNTAVKNFYKDTNNGIPLFSEMETISWENKQTYKYQVKLYSELSKLYSEGKRADYNIDFNDYPSFFGNSLLDHIKLSDDVKKVSSLNKGWTNELLQRLSISSDVNKLPFVYSFGKLWFMNEEVRLKYQENDTNVSEKPDMGEIIISADIFNDWESVFAYFRQEYKPHNQYSFIKDYNEILYKYIEQAKDVFSVFLAFSPIISLFENSYYCSSYSYNAMFNGCAVIDKYFIYGITSDESLIENVTQYQNKYERYLFKNKYFNLNYFNHEFENKQSEEYYTSMDPADFYSYHPLDKSDFNVLFEDESYDASNNYSEELKKAKGIVDQKEAERYYQTALNEVNEKYPGINLVNIAVNLLYHDKIENIGIELLEKYYNFLNNSFGLLNPLTERILKYYLIALEKSSDDFQKMYDLSLSFYIHSVPLYGIVSEYSRLSISMQAYSLFNLGRYSEAMNYIILFLIINKKIMDKHAIWFDAKYSVENELCYFSRLDIENLANRIYTHYSKLNDHENFDNYFNVGLFLLKNSNYVSIPLSSLLNYLYYFPANKKFKIETNYLHVILSNFDNFKNNHEITQCGLNLIDSIIAHYVKEEDKSEIIKWKEIKDNYLDILDYDNDESIKDIHSNNKVELAEHYQKSGNNKKALTFFLQNIYINRFDIQRQINTIGRLNNLFKQLHKHKETLLMLHLYYKFNHGIDNEQKAEILFSIAINLYQLRNFSFAYQKIYECTEILSSCSCSDSRTDRLRIAANELKSILATDDNKEQNKVRHNRLKDNNVQFKNYDSYIESIKTDLDNVYPELQFICETVNKYSYSINYSLYDISSYINTEDDPSLFNIEEYLINQNSESEFLEEIRELFIKEEQSETSESSDDSDDDTASEFEDTVADEYYPYNTFSRQKNEQSEDDSTDQDSIFCLDDSDYHEYKERPYIDF